MCTALSARRRGRVATRRKVTVDADDARGGANNELLAALCINRLLVRPHSGIGIALVRQGENWHEQPRVPLVIEQLRPIVRPQLHPPCETFGPVIAPSDSIIPFQEKWQEGLTGIQSACHRVPVPHEEVEKLLHLRVVPPTFLAADAVAAPDHAKVLAGVNCIRTTDERGEEAVYHFHV